MKNILLRVKEGFNKYKKKILITCIVMAIGVTSIVTFGGYYIYEKVKSNTKYTQAQCEEIALKKVPGEVVRVKKEIEDGALEYEFKIRDKNNMLQEVNVDASFGAITEVSYEEDDFHHEHEHKKFHQVKESDNNIVNINNI